MKLVDENWILSTRNDQLINFTYTYVNLIPSSSVIYTVVVSELMVTGKQVDISLMVMVNILSPSCIMLSIMSTSNDDDVIPAVIVTLCTSGDDLP